MKRAAAVLAVAVMMLAGCGIHVPPMQKDEIYVCRKNPVDQNEVQCMEFMEFMSRLSSRDSSAVDQ